MLRVNKILVLLFFVWSRSFLISQTNSFTFNVNGTVPAGFVEGLNDAALRWSQYLEIEVPIKVNVFTVNSSFLPFTGITFANGRQNFANAPHANFLYVTALANQIAGVETNPGEFDMDIYFNLATSFYFGNGMPKFFEVDFISTAMHEIGHGLGFYSAGYVDASGIGSFGNIPPSAINPATTSFPWRGQDGVPTIYDKFLSKKSLSSLTKCAPPNSVSLGDSIKNSPNYFNGPLFANASHSNSPIEVEGGAGTFSFGDDLLHLDSSFGSMMAYGGGSGDTIRLLTPIELGILREIGWDFTWPLGLSNLNSGKKSIDLYPNPASQCLSFAGEGIKSVKIYSALGKLIKTEFNSSENFLFSLSVSDLGPGLYVAELQVENQIGRPVKRFIKE